MMLFIYNEKATEFCLLKVVAHWPKGSNVEPQQGRGQASGCPTSEFQITIKFTKAFRLEAHGNRKKLDRCKIYKRNCSSREIAWKFQLLFELPESPLPIFERIRGRSQWVELFDTRILF